MAEDKTESPPKKKPGLLNTIFLKVLMLVMFALLLGMCTIKYMS